MLQDLQAAGANTYGFAGFIGELQDIELAANDIEQSRAADKVEAIKIQIKSLADEAAKLKDLKISFEMDDASLANAKNQIDQLKARAIIEPVAGAVKSTTTASKAAPTRQTGANSFTNVPPLPVKIEPVGYRQDGPNSFTNLPPYQWIFFRRAFSRTGKIASQIFLLSRWIFSRLESGEKVRTALLIYRPLMLRLRSIRSLPPKQARQSKRLSTI